MLHYSGYACLEHSNFLKVKYLNTTPISEYERAPQEDVARPHTLLCAATPQKFNYELLNCNNFNIRYWSWNYRGCWHQTCPPVGPR